MIKSPPLLRLLISLCWLQSCSLLPLNSAPPAYLKQVVAYPEGDGVVIYVVLADRKGTPTTAAGNVRVTISEKRMSFAAAAGMQEELVTLLTDDLIVPSSKFERTTVGKGAFARDEVLCSLGRFPYRSFRQPPKEVTGSVEVEFTPLNRPPLSGKTSLVFSP